MIEAAQAGQNSSPIAVIGAGSWGTALALLLARNGQSVRIWGHDPAHMARLQQSGVNEEFLPGYNFPNNLTACDQLSDALNGAGDILLVVPSHAFADILQLVRPWLNQLGRIAWATKGLEPHTGALLHEVVDNFTEGMVAKAVVSGPSFANEVAAGYPTAITVASDVATFAAEMARRLHGDRFRAYTSDDVVGVELGGSVKNVLAIATGITDGLGFGANTRSALITRGLAEMMRLGDALGGRRETLMGLAGLGDLVLTCTDNQSRNRRFGLALAEGQNLAAAEKKIGQVVEGIGTAREIRELARRTGVEMPIVEQTYQVLHQGRSPEKAIKALLARDQKSELE